MAYIPKNRYKIRYTNGNQYRLANSTKEYVGSYIKLSDGKVFAGNDINNIIKVMHKPSIKLKLKLLMFSKF